MEAAKCLQCLSKKELQAVTAQLLCNIYAAGAGPGGGLQYVFSEVGPPVGVVPVATAAIYFDTATGVQYNWFLNSWR